MGDEPQPTPKEMKDSEDKAADAARVFLEQYLAFPSAWSLDQAIEVMRDYQRCWMWGRKR